MRDTVMASSKTHRVKSWSSGTRSPTICLSHASGVLPTDARGDPEMVGCPRTVRRCAQKMETRLGSPSLNSSCVYSAIRSHGGSAPTLRTYSRPHPESGQGEARMGTERAPCSSLSCKPHQGSRELVSSVVGCWSLPRSRPIPQSDVGSLTERTQKPHSREQG